jgi:hypothetical protein
MMPLSEKTFGKRYMRKKQSGRLARQFGSRTAAATGRIITLNFELATDY